MGDRKVLLAQNLSREPIVDDYKKNLNASKYTEVYRIRENNYWTYS